jgi:hypothetical protein
MTARNAPQVPSSVASPTDVALMRGDVGSLSPADRIGLLRQLVADASLRWGAAPPVQLITTREGRLVPYLTKAGADQLAMVRGASIDRLELVDLEASKTVDATAYASDQSGRRNVDVGSCEYDPDRPATRARARMVAATRARRRVLLGLLGSGFAWSQDGDQAVGLEDVQVVDVEPDGGDA